MISLRQYSIISFLTTAAVVYHAFSTRRHFFPATLQLSTSKLAIATISNFCFAMALCCYRLIIKVFLGSLRDIELEKINERLHSAIMETCLALTIFRDEFNLTFLGMFALLAFIKVFHWLVQDRVEYMEVTPNVSRLQHVRIVSFMAFLLVLDSCFLQHTISNVLKSGGQSVHVLFAFEYVIQASSIISLFIKYCFYRADARLGGRWEAKGTAVFYLELLTDMVHLLVYCGFFVIVFTHYGLPLHLIRDLYMTFRNFRTRITDFLRFRQVTARMDRFPDATEEDLQRCHGVCIICREEMAATTPNKKLHCGHVFHVHCLRSWLERQQNCPTCRSNVFRPAPPPEGAAAAAGANAGAAGPAAAGAAAAGGAEAGALPGAAGGNQAGAPGARGGQQPPGGPAGGAPGHPHMHPHHQMPQPGGSRPGPYFPPPSSAPGGPGTPMIPGAYWPPPTIPAGYAWQVPQWYPVTSMATFHNPAMQSMQYAAQQSAEAMQGMAAVMPAMMPFLPGLSAPFAPLPLIPAPPPTATPEEQHLHTQAAAAAMAAAAAAMYTPLASLVMMPPTTLFNPAGFHPMAPPAMAAADPAGPSTSAAAEAGSSAAAAAAAASSSSQAATAAALGASMQATQSLLQQQLEYIQRLRDGLSAPAAAPAAAAGPSTSASAAAAATAPSASASTSAGASQAAAAPPASTDAAGTSTSTAPASTAPPAAAGSEIAPAAAREGEEEEELQRVRRRLAVADRPGQI